MERGFAVERFDAGLNGAMDHGVEFVFWSGKGEDVLVVFGGVDTGGGAVGVGDHCGAWWSLRLSELRLAHFESALAVFLLEKFDGLVVGDELFA